MKTEEKKDNQKTMTPEKIMPPAPDRSKKFYDLEELELHKTYFCRLSGILTMVTKIDKTPDGIKVEGMFWCQPTGCYLRNEIAPKQLFLFNSPDAPHPDRLQ